MNEAILYSLELTIAEVSFLLHKSIVALVVLMMDFSCPTLSYKSVHLESAGGHKVEMTRFVG
jgi:hypothetical protein